MLLTTADGGHGEESPPEAVEEGPVVGAVVLLGEVDEAGEGEDRDADQHHEKALWREARSQKHFTEADSSS